MITSGPVPLNDVARAVEEIQYAYDDLGIRCFWARPDQFNHRNLGDRYYDPIYELLQDLDCAFATHEYMGLNAADRRARTASTRSPSGTPSCTRTRRSTRCCR